MADSFAVARMSRVVGMSSTFVLDPGKLSVRIRNAAKKMLSTGVLVGGWSSQSKKVAKLSASLFGLPIVSDRYSNAINLNVTPKEIAERLVELAQADVAAYSLGPPDHHFYERNSSAWVIRVNRHRDRMAESIAAMRAGGSAYLHFSEEGLCDQAVEIIRHHHSKHATELREQVINWLDKGEPRIIPESLIGVV